MNHSSVTEFILQGFSLSQNKRVYLFIIFLVIYLLTLIANMMIIILVYSDHRLHSPMYMLLGHFSFLEICYTAVTVPKMLSDLIGEITSISVAGCIAQYHFFSLCAATEHFLLVTMAYDRYVAICHPLHYGGIMSNTFCMKLILSCWLISVVSLTIPAVSVSKLYFCGPNIIDHFFCEFNPLLKLSCTDTYVAQYIFNCLSWIIILGCLMCIALSYINIIGAIINIPSSYGKRKAFSTCASHLLVVGIFYGTVIFIYLRPKVDSPIHQNKIVSVFYIVVTPMLNPIIYSFKNESLRKAAVNLIKSITTPAAGKDIN
ncbi:PREDICTED: olfactory receptor 6Q1-like [Nanorana parkeri]|uniref:olfactory receptor 6Q1-like n=1 Tax=Nanorana parkeri TaxID=125878 RepID=UPI000854C3F0|nr:PREDICTED: olfactory receptor 6Q1-like [Nanorana parkeri]